MKSTLRIMTLLAIWLAQSPAMAWDLSTGVTLDKASGPIVGDRNPSASVSFEPKRVVINITDFFYSKGSFERPWVSLDTRKKATLHIGTKKSSGLFSFSTKDEFLREVSLTVDLSRVSRGTTLYILNDDTGEVLGHAVVQ